MSDSVGLQSYIPTITSVLAIAISSLTLGWTIYRDAIRKPKFRIDIAVKKIVQAGHDHDGPYVFVEALKSWADSEQNWPYISTQELD